MIIYIKELTADKTSLEQLLEVWVHSHNEIWTYELLQTYTYMHDLNRNEFGDTVANYGTKNLFFTTPGINIDINLALRFNHLWAVFISSC